MRCAPTRSPAPGRTAEAVDAYDTAIERTMNNAGRALLKRKTLGNRFTIQILNRIVIFRNPDSRIRCVVHFPPVIRIDSSPVLCKSSGKRCPADRVSCPQVVTVGSRTCAHPA